MRASLMRLRGAELLGPELDAVLLEHPAGLTRGGRRERGELVEVHRLEIGDAVHQCAIGGDGRVQLGAARRRPEVDRVALL
jgi:hypothetical protein